MLAPQGHMPECMHAHHLRLRCDVRLECDLRAMVHTTRPDFVGGPMLC